MGSQLSSLPERTEIIEKLRVLGVKNLELSTELQKDDFTKVCAQVNSVIDGTKKKALISYEEKKKIVERELADMKEALGSDDEEDTASNPLSIIEARRDRDLELLAARKSKKLAFQIQAFCRRKNDILISVTDLASEVKILLSKLRGDVDVAILQDSPPPGIRNETTILKLGDEALAEALAKIQQLEVSYAIAEKEKQMALDLSDKNAALLEEACNKVEDLEQAGKSAALEAKRKEIANAEQRQQAIAHLKLSLESKINALETKLEEAKVLANDTEKHHKNVGEQLEHETFAHKATRSELARAQVTAEEAEKLKNDITELQVELEKEKIEHKATQLSLATLQKTWNTCQPLLKSGKNARNGFMEMVDRHFNNGNFVALHGGKPNKDLVDIRNISVHEGDVRADFALYDLAYRPRQDRGRVSRVYGLKPGIFYSSCSGVVENANLYGTLYKCKAWTNFTHDKDKEDIFKEMHAENQAICDKVVESNVGSVAISKAFNSDPKVCSNLLAMQTIKKYFVEKERERQRQ